MLTGLRSRLILSYVVIISLTLCVVGVALVLLLINNRIPALQTYQRLTDIAREYASSLPADPERIDRRLAEIAAQEDIRILRVAPDRTILFDSSGQLAPGQPLNLRPLQSTDQAGEPRVQRGAYRDENRRQWLYVAFGPASARPEIGQIVLAAPRTRLPIFSSPGSDLLLPLLEAGLLSLVVSLLLAFLIGNSVARPLRRTVSATNAIAAGDYDQQVPELGPREVRDLARAFNDMSRQVQRTQHTQRDFLANVSHELKTPLTSIQGYSQAILDGAAADPSRAAQVIYDEAGRMRRLVDDLLDLARIESGQTQFSREYVNLPDLLTAILDRFTLRAQEKQIRLLPEITPLPRLTGDNDRLAQVFTNLLDNALTHTPPGGQITLRARPSDGGIQITVRDTGKGIPPEDLHRIFERFYQVDKSRSRAGRKGTGLGLTISKEIVELHGGTIHAESPQDGGALFVVWLPLPRSSDETVAGPSPKPAETTRPGHN
jgi:signal transduction histidine kinase